MNQKPASVFLPRLQDMLFIAIFVSILGLGARMLSIDSDLGRHLALGGYILDQAVIPVQDLLSHTLAGHPRPPYEWLSQVIFALAYRLAGLDLVILVSALVIAGAFAIVYADAVRRSRAPLTALMLAILAAAAASLHWLPRPHVFTFLMLAVWLQRLERVARGQNIPVWQFPALMILWANLHGGFLFGLLAWLAYLAGHLWSYWRRQEVVDRTILQKFLAIGLLSAIASIITPDGPANWQAVLNNHSQYILSQTIETMPVNFGLPNTWPFLLLLALAATVSLLTKTNFPAHYGFLLAGFALLGLGMLRNIPLFAIASAPILTEFGQLALGRFKAWSQLNGHLLDLESQLRSQAVWPIVVVFGAASFFGGHYLKTRDTFNHFDPRVFPAAAADWLMTNPQPDNMFNDFNWGGYLLYRLWPRQRVFLDSQTDFYGEDLVREYEQIIMARPGWEAVLDQHEVDWAIIPIGVPLASALAESGWLNLYQDSTAVILSRSARP